LEGDVQQRSEETRNRILEAANLLFSKNGYDATGVAEICNAAGVSKGAFYHHYPSKQAVFLASMENWLTNLNQGFNLTRQETKDIPQAMKAMAEMVGSIFQAADIRLSIFLEFWVQAYRDPVVWQAVISPYRHYQGYFTEMIREGIEQGSLRQVKPEHASRALVSLSIGLLMQALFDPTGTDWQAETRDSIALILDGLVRRDT
jgi:AcrR family transcriptional regulator